MKLSKEGRGAIFVALVILGALACGFVFLTLWIFRAAGFSCPCLPPYVAAFFGTAALVTWGFVVAFFRVPKRPLLADEGAIFSPCDGRVVVTEQVVEHEVTGEKRMQVSVFMSTTNVHINWFPVGGKVSYFKHHNGRFRVAWHPKSSEENERTTTVVDTARHGKIVFRQVAGFVARRIVSYARVGAEAVQNTPCGFIKFGSRMDIFVPLDAEILVSPGQKVRGGQTPIARFKA